VSSLRVELPASLELRCPQCQIPFRMDSVDVSRRQRLFCPACGRQSELYDMLEPQLRRKVYQAVRDAMEQRIHEQQLMDRAEYFEDELNL
jgi:transposase-like protein